MSEKKHHIILNILTVIMGIHLASIFAGYVIGLCFLKIDPDSAVHKWFFIWWCVAGVAWIVITNSVAAKNNKVKADVFSLGDISFDTWTAEFASTLEAYGYQQVRFGKEGPDDTFSLYVQTQSKDPLSCIVITKTHELTEALMDSVNDWITEQLKEYLHCKTIRRSVDMTIVLCIEKLSSAFNDLVNRHMEQRFKLGRLVVGITFGGKRVYVGNFKEGYGKWKYQELRERFLRLAGLEGQEPITRGIPLNKSAK